MFEANAKIASMKIKHIKPDTLLNQIKNNLSEIDSLYRAFASCEEDFVYRFYHQSYKIFYATEEIKKAKDLFEKIAPDGIPLNDWYGKIADKAIGKSFDWKKTNPKWLDETCPILEAFWHSKYFLQQMLRFGTEFQNSPQLMPSGWAAILYLYNLR